MKIFNRNLLCFMLLSMIIFMAAALSAQSARTRRLQAENVFEGIENEKVLDALRNFRRSFSGMNVPAADGRFLYDLIREKGYTRGLEIGTSNGYSALWIGLAMKINGGELITEIFPAHTISVSLVKE